jgi:uncharacterized protein (TIGR03067 family)
MDVAHYRGKREDGLFIGLIFAIPHIRTLMNNRGEFAMQFSSCQKRICLLALGVLFLLPLAIAKAQSPDDFILRDDFDSELSLDWEVVRPDPSHASLETHPGKLTITTQYGSIHMTQTTAKNMHFLDVPEGMDDFVVTTCIEEFLPETHWQQAGIMFWDDDDDNFIKWVRDCPTLDFPVLNVNWEIEQTDNRGRAYPVEFPKEKFWLRVIKRGELYQCLASVDGETFTTYAVIPYKDGTPTKVGLIAKNGPREGELPVQFDFFELRGLTEEEQNDEAFHIRMELRKKWKAVERALSGTPITEGPDTYINTWPGTFVLIEEEKLHLGFILDMEAEPNRITLVARQRGVGKLLNGIFSLEGDELTICLNTVLNGPAPEAFETVEGDGLMLLKLVPDKTE